MGNFYVNIAVQSEDRDAIRNAIPMEEDPGVVGPAENGWTVLSSAALDTQDETVVETYGTGLSRALGVPVLGALDHDDDILMLFLYRDGAEAAYLNTDPGNLTGEDLPPELRGLDAFADLAGMTGTDMKALLLKPAVFAVELHHQIADAMNLPKYTAGFGFRYAERGEFPHLDLVSFGR